MLFPTRLTSLLNTRGLIDSASLEYHHNNRRNSDSHKCPKTFWAVYVWTNRTNLLWKMMLKLRTKYFTWQELTYSIESISCVLMSWFLALSGHQHPCYWICWSGIIRSMHVECFAQQNLVISYGTYYTTDHTQRLERCVGLCDYCDRPIVLLYLIQKSRFTAIVYLRHWGRDG